MTRPTLYEYAAQVRRRYGRARKREKGRILDEFCQTAGLHRKAAIRLLGRGRGLAAVPKKMGRPRRYGPEVTEPLVKVWEARATGCGAASCWWECCRRWWRALSATENCVL